jgi:hypothetical protein
MPHPVKAMRKTTRNKMFSGILGESVHYFSVRGRRSRFKSSEAQAWLEATTAP